MKEEKRNRVERGDEEGRIREGKEGGQTKRETRGERRGTEEEIEKESDKGRETGDRRRDRKREKRHLLILLFLSQSQNATRVI